MKLLDPKIEIPDIEVKLDEGIDEPVENIVRNWGVRFPLVSINDKTIPLGNVTNYSLSIGINKLPSFTIQVNDVDKKQLLSLKEDTFNTCVIFIGEQKWYRKYQGIITKTYGSDDSLTLTGYLFNDKFYENNQVSFKEMSVKDVIIKLCKSMNIGLFMFEDNNSDINKVFNSINPGNRNLDYLLSFISKYTNNICCIDDNYFLHVGSIESMRQQEVDSYTIKNGKFFDEPKEINITNLLYNIENEDTTPEENYNLIVDSYYVDSDFGKSQINYSKEYTLNGEIKLKTVETDLGIGERTSNIFKPFEDRFNPYYGERLKRDMTGKAINLIMQDNLLEISPFLVINLNIYLNDELTEDGKNKLDEKHSGKKIIISYEESYSQDSESDNKYIQNITVI